MINLFKNLFSTKVSRAERLDDTLRGCELINQIEFIDASEAYSKISSDYQSSFINLYKLHPYLKYFLVVPKISYNSEIYFSYRMDDINKLSFKLHELGILNEFIKINTYRIDLLKHIYEDSSPVLDLFSKIEDSFKHMKLIHKAMEFNLIRKDK